MLKGLLMTYQRNLGNLNRTVKSIKEQYQCTPSRLTSRLTGFKIVPSRSPFIRNATKFLGFSVAAVGCFGATPPSPGLMFKMSPHYCPKESYKNNLKAMVVAMMMTDNLDSDEVTFLTNAVDCLYSEEGNTTCKSRGDWCLAEMKNYMKCAEKCYSFQDERCKKYQKMLKNCLKAKKGGLSYVQNPASVTGSDESSKISPAVRRNQHASKLSVPDAKVVPPPIVSDSTPSTLPTTAVINCDPPAEPLIPPEVCDSSEKKRTVTIDKCVPPAEPNISPMISEPTPTLDACDLPAKPVISEFEYSTEMYDQIKGTESACPDEGEGLKCDEICSSNLEFDPKLDDAEVCLLGYEEWKGKQQCGC